MLLKCEDIIGKVLLLLCICILFAGSSCTVQNSGSVIEGRQGSDKKQHSSVAVEGAGSRPKNSNRQVRADYLTPPHAIHYPIIVVQKEKRRLYLFDRQVLVRDYPVALGYKPVGDKERSDDGRTPEGEFLVCGKRDGGAADKALIISYPSYKHAERARFQGILSLDGVQNIRAALEKSIQPPVDTPLGGNVGIRGGGAHGDWTDGSVALYDSDMAELFHIAQLGTPVHIRP
jgi:hypothetical protein